jgi:hypothetical protein
MPNDSQANKPVASEIQLNEGVLEYRNSDGKLVWTAVVKDTLRSGED